MTSNPGSPMLFAKSFILLSSLAIGCHATLYQTVQELQPKGQYDFIIVGGGTAGSVLAHRLSENPRHRILVLESGLLNQGDLNTVVPYLGSFKYDWNSTTIPQAGLNGRTLVYPRGRVLGGSSVINAMFWTRGTVDDYDRWARVTRDSGWSWKNLLPYMLKMETLVPPADGHDTRGQVDPSLHGRRGPLLISLPGHPLEINDRVERAAKELGGDFRPILDMNSGKPIGTSWLQSTVGGGERSSAATSYLAPEYLNRKNLDVVVNTRVTRILLDDTAQNERKPAFRTVEVAVEDRVDSHRLTFTAKAEVVLCGGTVGTPHLLLHSGIGPRDELNTLGIKPIVHLPSVGKNLTDHPVTSVVWKANSTNTRDALRDPVVAERAFAEWNKTRTGPFTIMGLNHVNWQRIPFNDPIWEKFKDPTGGENTPHIELTFDNSAGFTGLSGFFVGAGLSLVTPHSRGQITLRTSNPFDHPLIDPNTFGSFFDAYAMLYALRSARRFFATRAFKGYVLGVAGLWTDGIIDDAEAAIQILRNTAHNARHPVGTAAMSPVDANWGVVDPDLRVKGVEGLRIVDASIMPFIPAAHTQSPVYIIAEKAADLIKDRYR